MGIILRGLVAIPLLMMLSLMVAVGFQTIEPVYTALTGSGLNLLGNPDVIMLMGSVTAILIPLVVILWWWIAPLRRDTRADIR